MRFLTSLQPPPEGFDPVTWVRRDLASGCVVLLVQGVDELSAALPGFAEVIVGCVLTVAPRLGLERLGRGLWHLSAPQDMLAEAVDVARGIACFAVDSSGVAERLALQEISVQRLTADLLTTRNDYNHSLSTLHDKVAEEAGLRNQLETFFSINPDLLCVGGTDWVFRKLNRAWLAFGYGLEELTGRSFVDLVHPDDLAATSESLGRLREGRDLVGFVNRYRCADGTYRYLEWHARLHGDEIFSTARDITERKEAEAREREMQRQLLHSQKLESLGVLAGGIAHDFNNLLAAILGNLELALMKLQQDSPARQGIERAVQASTRAAELTRQMLAYAGKGQFIVRCFNLNQVLHENVHLLDVIVPKNVTVTFDLAQELPDIEGDQAQMQQVVMNLITNGAESMGEQAGMLRVATGSQWCGSAYLRRSRLEEVPDDGLFVWFEVEDTGCGMDDETQGRLFDPFFTTKFTGRGMGMSAVLGIVRAHRGAIMIDTLVGRGTRIRVLLPAAARESESGGDVASAAAELECGEFSGTVIVADDDSCVREACACMLQAMGFTVLQASDGVDAVDLLQKSGHEVALVVLDLKMPRLDGVLAYERMRSLRSGVRVIMSSGYDESEIAGTVPGVAGFIQKPYRFSDLCRMVARVVQTAS